MAVERPNIEQLEAGDRDAWDAAFEWLWPVAFQAARNHLYGAPASEAEDIAIEAMSQLPRAVSQMRSAEVLPALVAVITRRLGISRFRRAQAGKRPRVVASLPDVEPCDLPAGGQEESGVDRLTDLERADLLRLLNEALDGLETSTRLLVWDHFFNHLTFLEMSRKHELPLGSVATAMSRGLGMLRRTLASRPKLLKALEEFLR